MRVLIVDDEALALSRLARLLQQIPAVEVVAALEGSDAALEAITRLRPDLVLLDVEMPHSDGFDLVESLSRRVADGRAVSPLVGFVTAYPHFALQAFETGALDFICKPVRLARLELLIERAERALVAREASRRLDDLNGHLNALREATGQVEERNFWLRHRGELVRIPIETIEWIEADGPYARVHADGSTYLLRSSIATLADQLADEGYSRVHKSAVVNRRKIAKVKTSPSGSKLVLDSGVEVPVGRKFREALKQIVGRPG